MTTVLQILGTSTPVSEVIANKIGLIRAAIACRVFFYQQLKDGVCSASVATLASKLGLSTGAVSTNLKWLISNGWIQYARPHTKGNVTNHYKVTTKFFKALEEHSPNEQAAVSRSRGESNIHEVNVHVHEVNGEEDIKEDLKEKDNNNNNFSKITLLWQQEIGMLSSIISQEIQDLMNDIAETNQVKWFTEAIKIAVKAGHQKKNLRYIKGILEKWITAGTMIIYDKTLKEKNNGHNIQLSSSKPQDTNSRQGERGSISERLSTPGTYRL